MSRRWFGTDGIRGVANVDLTVELAVAAGRAAAEVLGVRVAGDGSRSARLLVGRDTRRSGRLLEAAVAAGIASGGGDAYLAGVIPTPGVSRLAALDGYDGGVVISASHNPWRDNGIKLFGPDGKKLLDAVEIEVERHMHGTLDGAHAADDARAADDSGVEAAVGAIEDDLSAPPRYVDDLLQTLAPQIGGLRVLLDCAHGAMYRVAPLAFRAAGADVEAVCTQPDGRNINAGCGSTDLRFVAGRVAQGEYDLGLAFDGDGDRVLAVDAQGTSVDGDQVLAILADWLHRQGRLARDTVVVTSMSNLGFHRAMRERGIKVEVTDVGDRYVLERMEQVGAVLGGEQSGHVLYLTAGATGDGLLTGLLLCHVLRESGRSLAESAGIMTRFPQLLVNVRVADKSRLAQADQVWQAVRAEEEALGDEGRVVLRTSGTESLVRVMVEAPTRERCEEIAGRLAGDGGARAGLGCSGAAAPGPEHVTKRGVRLCAASSGMWATARAATSCSAGCASSSTGDTTPPASLVLTRGGSSCSTPSATSTISKSVLAQLATPSTVGIAHTRWATHGRPSNENAHPHTDCTDRFAIVLNGIVENYLSLRAELQAEGHVFTSETDAEVVAHLIERAYRGRCTRRWSRPTGRWRGTSPICAVAVDEPDVIVGVRKETPLVVGLGEGENFLASAIPAFLAETRSVIFPEDGDVVVIVADGRRRSSTSTASPVEPRWSRASTGTRRRPRRPATRRSCSRRSTSSPPPWPTPSPSGSAPTAGWCSMGWG